jgi:leucyl aminopeptidase
VFEIRLTGAAGTATRVVLVDRSGTPLGTDDPEIAELCRTASDPGAAGAVQVLPRPLRTPAKIVIVGVGAADESGYRAAGAAAVRAVAGDEPLQVLLPPAAGVRGLAEGLWLGGYRHRETVVELVTDEPGYARSDHPAALDRTEGSPLHQAHAVASAVWLARDVTNEPSSVKNPAWFADQVVAQARTRPGLAVTVRGPAELSRFGGLLAVGGGSATPPRFVELSWSPPGATRHVVLVGKGITFDTGGISIKTRDGMKLMRKDMAGAAAVIAATLAAADLNLPIRVTALTPLAENAVSGSAYRPGDVITHFDGTTSESTNSDAEGRLVLADALGYAVSTLDPDVVVDLATLTGANAVALGKRTAALYSHSSALAEALTAAGEVAGEQMWRMPLPADYLEYLRSDIADRHSSPSQGAGSVVAALFLQEFLGDRLENWAHLDMSAPSWAEETAGELVKGATGWGVRTLVRWLETGCR